MDRGGIERHHSSPAHKTEKRNRLLAVPGNPQGGLDGQVLADRGRKREVEEHESDRNILRGGRGRERHGLCTGPEGGGAPGVLVVHRRHAHQFGVHAAGKNSPNAQDVRLSGSFRRGLQSARA